jgi:hypothetical protein
MFDLRRFARLAAAEWVENRRAWAWFLGVVVIIHFVIVLVQSTGDDPYRNFSNDAQAAVFLAGLFVTAPVFAARYFQALSAPGPALLALLRPASTLEKWVLMVLVVAIAYPVAYHLAFYICDLPATLVAQAQAADELARLQPDADAWLRASLQPEKYRLFHFGDEDPVDWRGWLSIALVLTTLQAFAVAGSVVFRRMPFLKTLLAGFLVLLACLLVTTVFDSSPGPLFEYWRLAGPSAQALTPVQRLVFPLAWFAVPGLLWLATFLGLREREVA